MFNELHLCPCCAAHLRVPAQLQAMRCNQCDGELVFINQGGVRGLALLPNVDHVVPYSDPRQRVSGEPFDGRRLLEERREVLLRDAFVRHAKWAGLFRSVLVLLLAAGGATAMGMNQVLNGPRESIEVAAMMFLGGMVMIPLLAFVALHFQGRASMCAEQIKRWRR